MEMTQEKYDEILRLIRITRKEKNRLSQREAAAAVGFSTAWWRNVEAGRVKAGIDTLARMMFSLGISSDLLRDMGQTEAARGVEERRKFLETHQGTTDPAEVYLLRMPEVTARQKLSLLAHLRSIREIDKADPLTNEWMLSAHLSCSCSFTAAGTAGGTGQ